MRKPIQKIVALCCVGAMALCFASCKPDGGDDTTTSSAPVASESETEAPANGGDQSTEAPVTPTENNGGTSTGITKPADKAAAVNLYNDAVGKITSTSATITRKLNSGTAAGLADLMDLGVPAEFDLNNAPLEGAKLSKLDAANVSSMKCEEKGDNYVITFNLNSVSGNSSLKAGDGGYMYVLDYATITSLIDTIGHKLGGDGFNLTVNESSAKLALSNGQLIVTMNKTTGALSAVQLSFVQDVEAKVKYGISVPAKLQGQGTVSYTVA